jgi:hypothetical protein
MREKKAAGAKLAPAFALEYAQTNFNPLIQLAIRSQKQSA